MLLALGQGHVPSPLSFKPGSGRALTDFVGIYQFGKQGVRVPGLSIDFGTTNRADVVQVHVEVLRLLGSKAEEAQVHVEVVFLFASRSQEIP